MGECLKVKPKLELKLQLELKLELVMEVALVVEPNLKCDKRSKRKWGGRFESINVELSALEERELGKRVR
ncbi:hypothetical protein M0804_003511 [Polistes exclamans]|nr:hypothetical protein M0804_003511 [Polistes exclamans]